MEKFLINYIMGKKFI